MNHHSIKFKVGLYTLILSIILIVYTGLVFTRQNRMWTIIIGLPVILFLIGLMAKLLCRIILKPVEEIAQTLNRITHEDLSSQIETGYPDKEMRLLANAFNEMVLRLEKSFKHIVEFSSHVAHELKTPLAIIRGESEVALKRERTPQEYQEVIKGNLEEIERMTETIDDLLLLAKLDYRPEVFEFEPFDFIDFFREIGEQAKLLASQKDILVNIDIPDGPLTIEADRLHLRRLFFNLIHNAIKFNRVNGKIEITLRAKDGNVVVSISDTGIGIAPENLSKIFDSFFRIKAGQGIETGIGLGLTIARSIAKIHGGRIEVASTFGEGSTFTVVLPLP